MNNGRRASLARTATKLHLLKAKLEPLFTALADVTEDFDDLSNEIEQDRSDEEEAQELIIGDDRKDTMQSAIDAMQEAIDKLAELKEQVEALSVDGFDEVTAHLETAQE